MDKVFSCWIKDLCGNRKLTGINQNLRLFYPRRLNLSLKVNIKDQPKLDVCFVVPFQLVLFFGCIKPFISTLLHAPHLLTSAPFTHVTAQLHRTNSSFFNPKKKYKSTSLIHNIKKKKKKHISIIEIPPQKSLRFQ